jgi:ABC-type transport system substrate-binding protein
MVAVGLLASGQVLEVGIFEDMSTTNIWNRLGPGSTVWNSYVLDGKIMSLYGTSAPTWTWLPSLAADFPSDFVEQEDGTFAATVPIREGITWSDGTPFTADDVVFTYELLLTEVAEDTNMALAFGGNWPSYVISLLGVEKVDDYTVAFVYPYVPGLGEWTYGSLTCPIVQKAFWEPYYQAAMATDDPSGSLMAVVPEGEPIIGAYDLAKWEPGAFAEVRANSDYSFTGEAATQYEGGGAVIDNPKMGIHLEAYGGATGDVIISTTDGPYVDSIIYPIYLNQDAAVLALQQGEISYMLNPLGLAKGFRERLAGAANIEIIENPPWGFRYMGFNLRKPPMSYQAFRAAVATVLDREYLAENVFKGIVFPYYSVVPDSNPFWYNPDIHVYGKGLDHFGKVEEAVRILKEAGFSWEAEPVVLDRDQPRLARVAGQLPDGTIVTKPYGFKLPDGTPCPEVEFLIMTSGYDPLRHTFGLYIEQWCQEIGLPVEAVPTGFNLISERVFDLQDFDMYLMGWSLGNPAFPDYIYYFWHSSQTELGGFNANGYVNPEFDALAERFLATNDLEEARELVFKMQEILAIDLPYVVLFDTLIAEAYRTDMIEFPFTETLSGIQFIWPLTTVQAK